MTAATADGLDVVLDVSRLVSRILHDAPTGVDRVEMAYVEELSRRLGDRLSFALVHPAGGYGRVPRAAVLRFVDATRARWSGAARTSRGRLARMADAVPVLWRMRPRRPPRPDARRRILIQSSPHHLDDEALVRRILRREGARFVCMVHDLIPVEYPEYARPGGAATHLRRIGTVTRNAALIVANSHATRHALAPYLHGGGGGALCVAHLGLDVAPAAPAPAPAAVAGAAPYFVCLGTIEPRKNHLLLLNLWRKLATELPAAQVPRLVLVGRRGWENEQVVDMLERCPPLRAHVEEHAGLSDAEVRRRLAGARALLLPSFAEGYGLPVAEAIALGVPVLCSDLPALREAGGDVPDYLDPLDGKAWHDSVMAYCDPASTAREGQRRRMAGWQAPSWSRHVDVLLDAIEGLQT